MATETTTLAQVTEWAMETAAQGGASDRAELLVMIDQWESRAAVDWAWLIGEEEDKAIEALADATFRSDVAEALRAGVRAAPESIKWHETPVAGANMHLSDGALGYWATVPAEWTPAQVREAFLLTADYNETPRIEVTPREGNASARCFERCVDLEADAQLDEENGRILDAETTEGFAAYDAAKALR